MKRLFDSYLIVDWSAAARPVRGADSIWWALHRADAGLVARGNPTTRREAIDLLAHLLVTEAETGRRVLGGFDFPFGYPQGAARTLAERAQWSAVWQMLARRIEDGPDNANNRFEVAAALNRRFDGIGPFWGCPTTLHLPDLPERRSAVRGAHPPERRLVEQRAPSAQPTWKLYTTGSVGSQVLMGLPALERLRTDPRLAGRSAVWPFETGLAPPETSVCLAEIYPSLIPVRPETAEVKDAAQVRVTAAVFATLDEAGALAPLFSGPDELTLTERRIVEREEGWILGAGFEPRMRDVAS